MVTVLTGRAAEVYAQLRAADVAQYLTAVEQVEDSVVGTATSLLLPALLRDGRFAHLGFSAMHGGRSHDEFRADRGTFGRGSLQIVLQPASGAFYADLDRFSPFQDAASFVAHTVGEVFWPWLRGLFHRNGKDAV